ncbi:FkbM family methyltransferase [Aminobacter sp. AP02]|nr:FkbM family methyltransferase [Aminobacter sp. AP02]
MENADYVRVLFRTMLGREPDPEALGFFSDVLGDERDVRRLVDEIVASEEFANRHVPFKAASDLRPDISRTINIVDVGAQKLAAEDHVYMPLIAAGFRCRCIGFEPLSHHGTNLSSGDIAMSVYPNFIGDGSRQTFHINNDDATSSLLPLNLAFNSNFNHLETLRTTTTEGVDTSRLDDVLHDLAWVDLLKLDIQGFELAALRGAQQLLSRTNVVHCEVELGPIYMGQPLFSEVEQFLRAAGFSFIDFVTETRYSYTRSGVSGPSERLIWADAVFYRDSGSLSHEDRLAQAAIAMHVYEKNGLAQHVLAG